MRIGIVGAGSIGGWIGARLAGAGHEVSVLARGPTLAALRKDGIRLTSAAGTIAVPVTASDRAGELGPQDLVILAVKGPSLASVARETAALMGPETVLVPAMNGVPWWFTTGLGGAVESAAIEAADADGSIARALPVGSVLGCVVHAAALVAEPGHILHRGGNNLILGEPKGGSSARLASTAGVLRQAGFDVTESPKIQRDVWYKLWGNMTMNPISALTGATMDRILDDPDLTDWMLAMMAEAAAVGAAIGCPIAESGKDRIQVARRLGAFKTSMLQDAEAGRPLEIDLLLAAPRQIARLVGVPTPNLDALYGLARLFAETRQASRSAG